MRTRTIVAIGTALLGAGLSGCGSDPSPAPKGEQQKAMTVRNTADEQLKALGEPDRRIGLVRAIRQTGNRCPQRVESEKRQGEYRGQAVWTARCDDNSQWAIFVGANRQVQVRNCEQMERLRLPACAELPPAPPQLRMENGKAVPMERRR